MSECPEIVVYRICHVTRLIGDFPSCVARFIETKRNPKTGNHWVEFLPMIFSGNTAEAAIAAAREFWSDETAKIEARRSNIVKAREGRQRQRQSI